MTTSCFLVGVLAGFYIAVMAAYLLFKIFDGTIKEEK